MASITVLTEAGAATIDGAIDASSVWVASDALEGLIGWHLDEHGLCRGDVCLPMRERATTTRPDGRVDLVAMAALVGRPAVVDHEASVVAIGVEQDQRHRALRELTLPAFSLPDLDGRVHHSTDWRGPKTLLLAFSSW